MNLAEFASCVAALVSVIALWKSIKDKRFDEIKSEMKEGFSKVDKRFESVDKKFESMDWKIDDIKSEIVDIRERLVAIEVSTIFLEIKPNPPSRSEAAKKMWDRRRNKQLETKE